MGKITVGYKTGSGNIMEMTIHTNVLARADVSLIHDGDCCVEDMADVCQDGVGCKGQNGGCPPYAPLFGNIKPSKTHFCVITVEYDMAWPIKYGGWRKAGVTTPALYISAYANKITESYVRRILKGVESHGYYTLGASNCPGCSPKKCTVLLGQKCIKPKKRRYSMEAVGVNCCELHWQLFDEAMPWLYGNTAKFIHIRMWRYVGVFCENTVSVPNLVRGVVEKDWSVCPRTTRDLVRPELDIFTWTHPEGSYDEGESITVYQIPLDEMET